MLLIWSLCSVRQLSENGPQLNMDGAIQHDSYNNYNRVAGAGCACEGEWVVEWVGGEGGEGGGVQLGSVSSNQPQV